MAKVKIEKFDLAAANFNTHKRKYRVIHLIELAKDLKQFDLPLEGINLSGMPWGDVNMIDFIYHVNRMNQADLGHPIILDDEGYICDGWHRVAKAVLEGKETIKAVRLYQMPESVV